MVRSAYLRAARYGGLLRMRAKLVLVMAGLVPAIRVSFLRTSKAWMPGTRPGMTFSLKRIKL
jgi:hypothetical protein